MPGTQKLERVPGIKYSHTVTYYFLASLVGLMRSFQTDMGSLERLHGTIPWADVQTAINTENEKIAQQVIDLGYMTNRGVMMGAREFARNAAIFRREYSLH